jgi:hypothetical protein
MFDFMGKQPLVIVLHTMILETKPYTMSVVE